MNIITKLINKHNEKVKERNDTCDNYIDLINKITQEIDNIFLDSNNYIEPSIADKLQEDNQPVIDTITTNKIKKLRKARNYKTLENIHNQFNQKLNTLKQQITDHNNKVAETKIETAYKLIDKVEGYYLDKQQMNCVVKKTHNQLVIAGAGTGKTTTIIGKIKYLLATEKCKPEDILVLSFTNASATEMSERICKETHCHIDVSTFHKLGLNIIKEANHIYPKITNLNLRKFINEQLKQQMESQEYFDLLTHYLLFNQVVSKSEFDFKTENEYEEYLKLNPPTTIKNEEIKSYGEMDIANYLYQNGINYVYEQPYEIDTRTEEYSQYTPDFYLPDYHIYIEYFGINRNGEVPTYFKGKNGLSATETYQSSMKWKRELHNTNNTTLIECFAYEKFEDILLENLSKKLIDHSVKLTPRSTVELWKQISSENTSLLNGIIELFETVINLIKSNNYTINDIKHINKNNPHSKNNNIILTLIEPIFNSYCSYLKEHNEIDFNDMINLATECIVQKKYINPYKYVIVDEYQDISKARFSLLDHLRKSKDFDLFCVGDDWQSIYRFAGSDISYIIHFEKYWGATEISRIETTYRFSQKLIEISGRFIMQNPMQIKKTIRGKDDYIGFPLEEVNGYTEDYAIEFMVNKLDDLPRDSTIYFIGRYSFDGKVLDKNINLQTQYNKETGYVDVIYRKRTDLTISFITAHKSKGLQADYVFIINNKKSRMGFPSKIQDAPILDLLLDNCDNYPYAEERRLFYVALTRAKKKAYFVTIKNKESEFASELRYWYYDELKREQYTCPQCGGHLVKRSSQYGEFFGCSNYKNGCKYIRKIK